jgi:hypothetical protein
MIHQLMLEILWLRWYGVAGMLYKHHQQEEESGASETGAAAPPAHGCKFQKSAQSQMSPLVGRRSMVCSH